MRTAPIGVFFAQNEGARRQASFADSALTHADPHCQLACAAFNAAIACGVRAGAAIPAPAALAEAAAQELEAASTALAKNFPGEEERVWEAREGLREDLALARKLDPQLAGGRTPICYNQGSVRAAFRLAFWEPWHTTSYREALVDVVNRGGDADTNGAITGALLGARFGAVGIPPILADLRPAGDDRWAAHEAWPGLSPRALPGFPSALAQANPANFGRRIINIWMI